MHGPLEGEQKFHRRHMWPVPAPASSSVTAAESASDALSFFSKDGRKIHVGDCALFKPPHDSPPFIGIVRRLIFGKENSLSLCVNWLYRPADIKLGKGVLLEAAPNEVFYSFHKDEIPAASLLHPCKVAFLCKGVELPSGILSFVCRRVYDIENKCLWWLTDKDYINERQEEVDQLLDRTRLEMYGAVQSGGRSPKPLTGPTTTPQLKPGSDNVQNSSSSFPSQVKGKKRERTDQVSDPVKRERLSKPVDTDSGEYKPEYILKSEIAKVTDKGGLVDIEGVEKFVQLMQSHSGEKKIDLACRIMLVDVIAVTDRFDCLGRFVQLRGLAVLDEWLQEVHKGKIGDGSSCSKEGDKTIEDFLFALLRGLDKLPVNLQALQTCNVGKSVNHLRTHKNTEIQKKARSLVDTWKKQVEAEMNYIDAKSGSGRGASWPSKSAISEISHVGSRRGGGPLEVGVKSSALQPNSSKTLSVKPGSGDSVVKYSSQPPGSTKLSASLVTSGAANSKDLNSVTLAGGGTSEMPMTTIKEEKSSSSSQSQNNSQSCSSDQAKTGASSCKEDARSSTAGSMGVSRSSGGASRNQKLTNGLPGLTIPDVQKEIDCGKFSSSSRNVVSEKLSPSRVTCDRVLDLPLVDNGNSQRLIVRLPNTSRSPACSASGGSPEDPSVTSYKAASPVHTEKLDNQDRKVKGRIDPLQANVTTNESMESFQDKDVPSGSDDINKSSCAPCDMQSRNDGDSEKNTEADKGLGLSSRIIPKTEKSYEAAFSSMNALIESCAKFSETNGSTSLGDDIGMNLLASVATGEILRSDASPSNSPGRTSHAPEDSCSGNEVKLRQSDVVGARNEDKPNDAILATEDATKEGDAVGEGDDYLHERLGVKWPRNNGVSDSKPKVRSSVLDEERNANHVDEKATKEATETGATTTSEIDGNEDLPCLSSSETCMEDKNVVHKQSGSCIVGEQNPHVGGEKVDNDLPPSCNVLVKELKPDDLQIRSHPEQIEKHKVDVDSSDLHPKCEQVHHESEKEVFLCPPGDSTNHEDTPAMLAHKAEQCVKPSVSEKDGVEADVVDKLVSVANSSSLPTSGLDVACKLDFDLNEGFSTDEGNQGEPVKSSLPGNSSMHLPCPLPLPISSMSGSFTASITVAAAAKGPFVPPENLTRIKGELGWKGSAATSAFRPAEPRKVFEMPFNTSDVQPVERTFSKQNRPLLDIDLNIPDEKMLEDVASQSSGRLMGSESGYRDHSGGGFDLDLNRVDENPEQLPVNNCRLEILQLSCKTPLSGGFSKAEPNASRDFDLNNGPSPDEPGPEAASHAKNSLPFLSVPGVKMSHTEMGNLSPWFPPANSYSAIAIPSILPSRGEHSYSVVPASGSQRILGPPTANSSFCPEIYRGPVLPSSPAVAFPPTTPFQYPGFPFETNFPIQSSSYAAGSTAFVDSSSAGPICFPAMHSQLVGPTAMVSTHYPRPYIVGLSGGTSNAVPESRKWGGQGLDLNAGPGGTDLERRDERIACGLRQLPLTGSQALAEEQLKMYQMAGGVLKRKEPDGGWDGDRINYKQPPAWQ